MSSSQQKFDVVYLKSGGKVIGKIIEKHENQPVILQLQSGDQITIRWDDIKAFDVVTVQEKSIDEKIKEESANDADFPWRLIYISGNELRLNRLVSLSDTRLAALRNDKSISIPIDSIAALVHFKEGHFWIGAGIGFVAGTAAGLIIGAAAAPKADPNKPIQSFANQGGSLATGLIIGAPLGFIAGGIIGGTDGYETYDLRGQKDVKMKRQILQEAVDD